MIVQTSRGPISIDGAKAVIHSPSPLAFVGRALGFIPIILSLLIAAGVMIGLLDMFRSYHNNGEMNPSTGSWIGDFLLITAFIFVAYQFARIGMSVVTGNISKHGALYDFFSMKFQTLLIFSTACSAVGTILVTTLNFVTRSPGDHWYETPVQIFLPMVAFFVILSAIARLSGLIDAKVSYFDGTSLNVRNLSYLDIEKLNDALSLRHANATDPKP